jgi:hypothetical protein
MFLDCSSNNKKSNLKYWNENSTSSSIKISLDSITSFYFLYADYYNWEEKSKKFVAYQDFIKSTTVNYLNIYDLNQKKHIQKIELDYEGPNGIGSPAGFLLKTMDSIYVPSPYKYSIYLINSKGEVLGNYKLSTKFVKNVSSLMYLRNFNKMFMNENKLFVPGSPDFDGNDGNYSVKGHMNVFNLENDSSYSLIGYSHKYKSNEYWSPQQLLSSIAFNSVDKRIIVNYPVDPFLYIYDTKGKLIDSVLVKSKIIEEDIKASKIPLEGFEEGLRFSYSSDEYFGVIYDPVNQLYYRFIKGKFSDESIEQMLQQKRGQPGKRSIIVLNNDLTFKKELLINPDKYIIDDAFIGPDGLYLLKKTELEDVKEYVHFNIEKN